MAGQTSCGGISPRQGLTALILGLLISGVSTLVHSLHGHVPSLPLAGATSVLVILGCLPLSARRLSLGRAIAVLAAGEALIHGWLAWFSMPVAGTPLTTTATLHHGDHITATLAPHDFSVLIPSPAMLAAHLAAAVVLAWIVCSIDRLSCAAIRLLAFLGLSLPSMPGRLDRPRQVPTWVHLGMPRSVPWALVVRRRGPPAASAA